MVITNPLIIVFPFSLRLELVFNREQNTPTKITESMFDDLNKAAIGKLK